MAGITVSPDQISQARSAGYSDQDIVNYLSPQAPDQFGAAAKAGYSPTEILSHLAPPPSGLVDNLKEGGAEAVGGVGKTLEAFTGKGPIGTFLQKTGERMAPKDFVPSPVIDKDGFHASGILPTLARAAPAVAGGVLAAGAAAPLGTVGAIGAGALAGTAMTAGPAAQQAADARAGAPNSPITTPDLVRGGATSAASSLVGALPITHFLPGTGTLVKTGTAGALNAVKKLGVTAADQSAASATADAVGQVGQSVGTPGGVSVDPTQVANSAATGALTGTAFGAKNAYKQAVNASTYSGITPDLREAATQVANRIQQNAGGENLQAGFLTGSKAQAAGADAFNKTQAAISNELGAAVADLNSRVTLPTDANNVLKAALSGQQPNARDYGILQSAVATDPQGANVMNLVRQAHAADVFAKTGNLTDSKFTGGISGKAGSILTHGNIEKSAIAGLGGAALEGGAGHIIAYSPAVLGVAAAGALGARAIDNLTGARSPAGRIVSNFADGTTPIRLPTPQAPAAAPAAPNTAPQAPMIGPPRPWSSPLAVQALLASQRTAANAAAAARQQTTAPPMAGGSIITPAVRAQMTNYTNLQQIAAKNAAQRVAATPVAAAPKINTSSIITPAVRASMNSYENLNKIAAAKQVPVQLPDNFASSLPSATNAASAAPAEPTINPLALPRNITGPASVIMKGAALASKLKAENLGSQAATAEVNASPFIQQKVGSAANIPTPAAAKLMSKAVSSANILAKLQSDPEAEAADKAEAKANLKAASAAARAATATVKSTPPETITAAAIKHADGAVFTGVNHADIFNRPDYRYESSAKDGFVTSKGRFVDRAEAAAVANKAAQGTPSGVSRMREPTLTAEDLPANFAANLHKGPQTVVKTNGTTQVNSEPFPASSYAHLPSHQAAEAITKSAVSAGNVKFANGFRASTKARIDGERAVMANIGAAHPALPIANLTARLEGAPDQKTAKEFREHMKQTYPDAASAFDQHLSDEAIGKLWKRKG